MNKNLREAHIECYQLDKNDGLWKQSSLMTIYISYYDLRD